MAATVLSILLLSVTLLVRTHGEHEDNGFQEKLQPRNVARDDNLISNSDLWEFRRNGLSVAEKKDARSRRGEEQMFDTMLDGFMENVGLQDAVKYQPQPKNGLAWTGRPGFLEYRTTPQHVRTRSHHSLEPSSEDVSQVTLLLRPRCCVFKRIDFAFLSATGETNQTRAWCGSVKNTDEVEGCFGQRLNDVLATSKLCTG
jgi:hypothetical protein